MQYVLFIVYTDPSIWEALSTDERNVIHAECGAWHQDLLKKGQAVFAAGLLPPETTVGVRLKDGKVTITDGPFTETKEVIGGFEIIECDTPEEATEIASRFPALRAGASISIRPTVPGGECKD